MKHDLVIFLDFDGVFHHSPKLKNKTDEENSVFFFTPNVEEICKELKNYFNLKIVFSTTWKTKFSFDDLKDFFEDYPSIYSSCYDCTPNILTSSNIGSKLLESKEWIKKYDYNGYFLILDDNPDLWIDENNKLTDNFILCDNKFDEVEMNLIRNFLNINKPKFKNIYSK